MYGKKATRLCPCGYAGSRLRDCTCSPERVARYQRAVSGPLLDRIDLRIAVEPVPAGTLARPADGESGAVVRERVAAAARRQLTRQGCVNALLAPQALDLHCPASPAGLALLHQASARFGWSARAWHRVMRVARTIADLAGSDTIADAHLAEAIHYRRVLPAA